MKVIADSAVKVFNLLNRILGCCLLLPVAIVAVTLAWLAVLVVAWIGLILFFIALVVFSPKAIEELIKSLGNPE